MPRTIASAGALVALIAVYLLAFLANAKPSAADKVTLLFLAIVAALAFIPALKRKLVNDENAATFGLVAVAFVLYQLAERAGPAEGFALRFASLPDDRFVISYALWAAILGALVSIPAWWRLNGPERYIAISLVLVGVLGSGIFWYLSRYYAVGVTETLDPTPMITLYLQIVGYGSLALCCRAVAVHDRLRQIVALTLPPALLALWARHTFGPGIVEEEE